MVGESAAKAALREHFGYEEFRPGQQGVVEAILAGRDALVVPTPCDRHEAFIIPSDICFAASACDPRRLGIDVTGAWAVAANALSYDYLWNEIRVKGARRRMARQL